MRSITGNKGNSIPRNVMVVTLNASRCDPPTDTTIARFQLLRLMYSVMNGRRDYDIMGHNSNCRDIRIFWQAAQQWSEKKRPLWIFTYDATLFLELSGFFHLLQYGELTLTERTFYNRDTGEKVKRKTCVIDGPPTIVKCQMGEKKFIIVDIRNYLNQPFRSIRKVRTHDGDGVDMDSSYPHDDFRLGCHDHDCMIDLVSSTLLAWKAADCGVWQPTAAKLALTSYRHMGIRPRIVYHEDADAHKIERSAYFGGDVRAFRIGEVFGKIYKVDCRSMYPYLMQRYAFPWRLDGWKMSPSVQELKTITESYGVIADVNLADARGDFPVRVGIGEQGRIVNVYDGNPIPQQLRYHRTIYPCGPVRTVLTTPEVIDALKRGLVSSVNRVALYSCGTIFRRWVSKFWQMRMELESAGEDTKAAIVKSILVSLYGKFGQLSQGWQDGSGISAQVPYGHWYHTRHDTGETVRCRAVSCHTQVQGKRESTNTTFAAIPAHVTAMGRLYMRMLRDSMPIDSVLHQSTDCLLVTEEGFRHMWVKGCVDPKRMGFFAMKDCADRVTIYSNVAYSMNGRTVSSGVDTFRHGDSDRTFETIRRGRRAMHMLDMAEAIAERELRTVTVHPRKPFGYVDETGWVHPAPIAFANGGNSTDAGKG